MAKVWFLYNNSQVPDEKRFKHSSEPFLVVIFSNHLEGL